MTERMVWHGLWLPWSSAQMQHILFRNTACLRRAKRTYNNDSGRIMCNLHGVYIDTSSVRSLSARLTTKMSIYASNHLTKWYKIGEQEGVSFSNKGKGKAVPLQAWSGLEGCRKLRFPDYMTAQDGGKVVSPTHRPPLPPRNAPGTHFC